MYLLPPSFTFPFPPDPLSLKTSGDPTALRTRDSRSDQQFIIQVTCLPARLIDVPSIYPAAPIALTDGPS